MPRAQGHPHDENPLLRCATAHTHERHPVTVIHQSEEHMSEIVNPSMKFADMRIGEQLVFVVKLCVFFASFGFAFPTLLSN